MIKNMMTKKKFTAEVLEHIKKGKMHNCDPTYIDAVVEVCEANDILVEDTSRLLDDSIKAHIEVEAKKLRLIKQEGVTTSLKDHIK